MIDESFHLTPLDVRRWDCGTQMRGYDKARVDDLREKVADELERLTRVNQDLDAKARGFHEQLRAFRERDKALNEALVSAQQLRNETREQAEREAQLIIREAQGEAERIVEAAKAEARRVSVEIDGLERARRAFLTQMRMLTERQLAEIEAAEAVEPQAPQSVHAQGGPAGDDRTPTHTPAWLKAVDTE